MKRYILIVTIIGLFCLNSCEKLGSNFSQLFSIVSTENIAMAGATEFIKAHPDSIGVLKQVTERITELSTKDTLTKAEIERSLEQVVINSKSTAKNEILVAVRATIDQVFVDEEIDVSSYKKKFEDIVIGINAAIRYYEMINSQVIETK